MKTVSFAQTTVSRIHPELTASLVSVGKVRAWLHQQAQNDALLASECPMSAQTLITDLLTVRGFNLTRIALELDVSKASISRLWRGHIKNPHSKTLRKLLLLYCRVMSLRPARKELSEHPAA